MPAMIPRRLPRLLLEHRLVLAEDLDVDRLRHAAGQVADVVLEQLAEVGADRRLDRLDPRPQVVDDGVDRRRRGRAA